MGIFKRGRPSRQSPPSGPGLYRWVEKATGSIAYIGESNDLRRRMREHERSDKPWSRDTHHYEWKRADGRSSSQTRREHEKAKIQKHQPRGNRNGGGGGRKAR